MRSVALVHHAGEAFRTLLGESGIGRIRLVERGDGAAGLLA